MTSQDKQWNFCRTEDKTRITNEVTRVCHITYRFYIKPPGSEPVPKNRRACPSRPPDTPCVATPTRWLLNEHRCGSHEWRIFSKTCTCKWILRIVSPAKKTMTTKLFKWFKQKVHRTFFQHNFERACGCVALQVCFLAHRGPQDTNPSPQSGLLSCSLLAARHETMMEDASFCAQVQHGEPLVISASLRNGSSRFPSATVIRSVFLEQLSRTPDTKKSCQQLSKQHPKKTITETFCAQRHSSLQQRSSDINLLSKCLRAAPTSQSARDTNNKHEKKNEKQHLSLRSCL